MDMISYHRRDSSVSSIGSPYSYDTDSLDDDILGDLFQVSNNYSEIRPLRRRLGSEMAILASTSPEIKALNLPITPSFPEHERKSRHRRNKSTDTWSSACSSASSSTTRTLTSHMLIFDLNDAEESIAIPDCSRLEMLKTGDDETEDLVESFVRHNIKTPKISNCGGHCIAEDKENIHPNIRNPKISSSRKKKRGSQRTIRYPNIGVSSPRQSKYCIRKPTLHRRVSFDSLPSPDEIESSPKDSDEFLVFEPFSSPTMEKGLENYDVKVARFDDQRACNKNLRY